MMELAYNTTEAGKRLGGLHARDVCTLIKTGKLRAKRQVVRGKGRKPRYLVLESAIDDYLLHLEDASVAGPQQPPPRKRQTPRGNLTGVIAFV